MTPPWFIWLKHTTLRKHHNITEVLWFQDVLVGICQHELSLLKIKSAVLCFKPYYASASCQAGLLCSCVCPRFRLMRYIIFTSHFTALKSTQGSEVQSSSVCSENSYNNTASLSVELQMLAVLTLIHSLIIFLFSRQNVIMS